MIYFLLLGHCQQTYRTEKLTISKNIFVDLLTSRWGGGGNAVEHKNAFYSP